MLCQKYNADFVKKWLSFNQKVRKLHLQTALEAKAANIFKVDFCCVSSKDQIKMCQLAIFSFLALPEK
jgi:hypothetical protein